MPRLPFFSHRVFAAFAAALFVAASASPVAAKVIEAHPQMWVVHGPKGTAYMLGSIHVLPPNVHWQTPQIKKAMAAADTFVFEIPLDHQQKDALKFQNVQKQVMDANGLLPPGQSLRASLPETLVPKYDAALQKLDIVPGYVDRLQPWLAAMVIQNAEFYRSDFDPSLGVDRQVFAIAQKMNKKTRGFETLEDQIAIITPAEQKAGIDSLAEEIASASGNNDIKQVNALVDAWAHGNVEMLSEMSTRDFAKDPALKKAILDDRNHRWVGELKAMLDQKQIYFITVGAAHLAGPGGVPALMHDAGYKVDGPIDAPTPPGLRTARE